MNLLKINIIRKKQIIKDDWKKLITIALNVMHMLKKKKYILPKFQNITQSMENKSKF